MLYRALLTKYTDLRGLHTLMHKIGAPIGASATQVNFLLLPITMVLDYTYAELYSSLLLDAYLEYKSISREIGEGISTYRHTALHEPTHLQHRGGFHAARRHWSLAPDS